MLKTYQGSCHCGAVHFEADIDLSHGTSRCNCSFCSKIRNWVAIVKPDAFRLLSGEDALSDYQFGGKVNHHFFCRHCGVQVFGKGIVEAIGGHYVGIELAALDKAQPQELIDAPLRYMDGRHNAWFNTPSETRHL